MGSPANARAPKLRRGGPKIGGKGISEGGYKGAIGTYKASKYGVTF